MDRYKIAKGKKAVKTLAAIDSDMTFTSGRLDTHTIDFLDTYRLCDRLCEGQLDLEMSKKAELCIKLAELQGIAMPNIAEHVRVKNYMDLTMSDLRNAVNAAARPNRYDLLRQEKKKK